jgi:hypothetical protein
VKRIARKQLFETPQSIIPYSDGHISWDEFFLDGNQVNHQNFDPFLLVYKCWLIFMVMKRVFSPFLSLRWTA